MRMVAVADDVQSQGMGAGNAFTIAASSKAFEVLSSNLYQDKILAVIREITCNAADAHAVAGKPLSDIQVTLPTVMTPYFAVRDFGSGLSQEDVLSLYTTYFRSTKDGDNSQIGGFGLGSKSPFAVADQFTVTSWHGGTKSTYVCYKDGGLPRVNVVATGPYDQNDTGIEVRVGARNYDDWNSKARQFFRWWPTLPSIKGAAGFACPSVWADGATIAKAETGVGGVPDWALFPGTAMGSKVFMGLVAYRLDLTAIPSMPNALRDIFAGQDVFLRFNVGDVAISPSREALSYDPTTCAAIIEKLKVVLREASANYRKGLDAQPNLLAARKYVYGTHTNETSAFVRKLGDTKSLLWKGQPIPTTVHVDAPEMGEDVAFDRINKSTHRQVPQRVAHNMNWVEHNARSQEVFFWSAKAPRNFTAILAEYFKPAVRWASIIIKGGNFDEVKAKCEELGIPVPIDYATLPVPAKAVAQAKTYARTKGYEFDKLMDYKRATSELPLAGGGLFLEFCEGHPRLCPDYRALKELFRHGFFKTPPRVIGLPMASKRTKALETALKTNGWQQFDKAWFEANVNSDWLRDEFTRQSIRNWYGMNNGLISQENLLRVVPRIKLKEATNFFDVVVPHLKDSFTHIPQPRQARTNFHDVASAAQRDAMDYGMKESDKAAAAWKVFLDGHPLMRYLDLRNIPLDRLVEYVNR